MSLQNVQAQLGNLLAAMPLKVQKVPSSFLDSTTPPFEGALASDSDGQFYVSQKDSNGGLIWQQIIDKVVRDAVAGRSNSEFLACMELPLGFEDSTVFFNTTLEGDKFSAFVQYEPPASDASKMYIFSVSSVTSSGFNLHVSDSVSEAGGKIHVFAKGYSEQQGGSPYTQGQA